MTNPFILCEVSYSKSYFAEKGVGEEILQNKPALFKNVLEPNLNLCVFSFINKTHNKKTLFNG